MSATYEDFKGPFLLNAQLVAKPGKGDEVAGWLAKIKEVADSDAEPGTLLYLNARFGDKFSVWEIYANPQAFEAHANGSWSNFEKLNLLAEKPVPLFYSPPGYTS